MTSPPDHSHEPADLSELAATDALLDRLGARRPTDDDLLDPSVAVLAELIAQVDRSRQPDLGAARLLEVLAGRPLYIAGAEPATGDNRRLIDLTEADALDDGPAGTGTPAAGIGAETRVAPLGADEPVEGGTEIAASIAVPVARLPRPAVTPITARKASEPAGSWRWERVFSHVSLPAASVLLLLAVGGGVSAAVTGDPMAPVNGITRVVEQLPGVDDNSSLDRVKTEISAAESAARRRDATGAYLHLERAREGLDDVPAADQSSLSALIDKVEGMVPTAAPTTSVGVPGVGVPSGSGSVPDVVVTPTPTPTADAKPSSTPTPTVNPTTDPPTTGPTAAPVTSAPASPADPVPSTQAVAVESTPVAATSSP